MSECSCHSFYGFLSRFCSINLLLDTKTATSDSRLQALGMFGMLYSTFLSKAFGASCSLHSHIHKKIHNAVSIFDIRVKISNKARKKGPILTSPWLLGKAAVSVKLLPFHFKPSYGGNLLLLSKCWHCGKIQTCLSKFVTQRTQNRQKEPFLGSNKVHAQRILRTAQRKAN